MIAPNIVLESVRPEHSKMIAEQLADRYKYVTLEQPTTDAKRYYNYLRYWMRLNGWLASDTPYLFDSGHISQLVHYGHKDEHTARYIAREERFNCKLTQETALFRPTVIVYLMTGNCNNKLEFKYGCLTIMSRMAHITVDMDDHDTGNYRPPVDIVNEIVTRIEAN